MPETIAVPDDGQIKNDVAINWVERAGPSQFIELHTTRCDLIGVSRGAEPGHFGEDALRVRKTEDGIKVSIVDAVSRSTEQISPARIQAEIVAEELVLNDPGIAFANAEKRIEEVNRVRSSQNLPLLETDPVSHPIAVAELCHLFDGPTYVQPIGTGDVAILGFVPNGDGKFTSESVRLLYFNPTGDKKKDHVWSETRHAAPGRQLKLPNPTILPDGSVFLLASDGGLEALFDSSVLSAANIKASGREQAIIQNIQGDLFDKEDVIDSLRHVMKRIAEILNAHDSLSRIKSLVRELQVAKGARIHDDATVVFGKIKAEGPANKIYEFSADVKPLIAALSVDPRELPLNTDDILKRYGRENAIQLVKELIEQDATGGIFFADACSLVRFDWLPEETQNWFKKRGLLLLEGENIKVNLRHQNDFTFGAAGCHEIGQYLIYGMPAGQRIDVQQEPTQVAKGSFTAHDSSNKFPHGAWAQVEIWTRMHFTVAGGFIAGTGPNARGILVPSDNFVFYWHTPNSWTKGKGEKNFYIKQGGLHNYADYGLYSLAKHLKGEIPAV